MIRARAVEDWGILRSCWVRSYGHSRFARACGNHYEAVQTRIARRLISECDALVACDPDAPRVVWGFICFQSPCLHFVAVVPELRGNGIARELLAGLKFDRCSHEGWRGLPWTPQEAWHQEPVSAQSRDGRTSPP